MKKIQFNNYDSDEIEIKDIFKTIKRNKKYLFSILSVLFLIFVFSGKNIEKIYKSQLKLYFNTSDKNFIEKNNRIRLLRTIEILLTGEFNQLEQNYNEKKINPSNKISTYFISSNENPYSKLNFRFIGNTNILEISYSNISEEKSINKILEVEEKLKNIQKLGGFQIQDLIRYSTSDIVLTKKEKEKEKQLLTIQNNNTKKSYFNRIEPPNIIVKNNLRTEQNLLVSLFLALTISIIFLYIKEKVSPFITDFEKLKKAINQNYIDTITLDNSNYSKKNILYIFEQNNIPYSIGAFDGSSIGSNDRDNLTKSFRELNIDMKQLSIFDEQSINKYENLIILLPENKCKYKDLEILKNHLKFYQEKIIGWIYIKN